MGQRTMCVRALLVLAALSAISALPFSRNRKTKVIEITQQEALQQAISLTDSPSLLIFYRSSDSPSQQLEPMVEEVAGKVAGMGQVLGFDLDTTEKWLLKMFQIPNVPVIAAFPSRIEAMKRGGQMQPVPFQSNSPTVDSLARFLMAQVPNLSTLIKSEDDWNSIFEKSTPFEDDLGQSIPRVALFSAKTSTPPVYKALSTGFADRAKFMELREGKVEELIKEIGVESFPTLRVYPDPKDLEKYHDYSGEGFKYANLEAFLNDYCISKMQREEHLMKKQESTAKQAQQNAKAKEEKDNANDVVNAAERVASEADWQKSVISKNLISVIAFLDPSSDKHKDNLKVMRHAYRRSKKAGKKHNFVWVNGFKQEGLASTFGLDPTAYPTVAFMHPKKGWFKNYIGAYSEKNLASFITTNLDRGAGRPLKEGAIKELVDEELTDEARAAEELTPEDIDPEKAKKAEEAKKLAEEKKKEDEEIEKFKLSPEEEKRRKEKKRKVESKRNADREAKKAAREAKKKEREEKLRLEKEKREKRQKKRKLREEKEKAEGGKDKKKKPAKPAAKKAAKKKPASKKGKKARDEL